MKHRPFTNIFATMRKNIFPRTYAVKIAVEIIEKLFISNRNITITINYSRKIPWLKDTQATVLIAMGKRLKEKLLDMCDKVTITEIRPIVPKYRMMDEVLVLETWEIREVNRGIWDKGEYILEKASEVWVRETRHRSELVKLPLSIDSFH